MIANEMRRDSNNIRQGDSRRVRVRHVPRPAQRRSSSTSTPLGGRTDGQITNERQFNADWNPVWRLSAGRFDGGWTIEAAMPFKSLRYAPGTTQVWGFQARRIEQVEERDLVPDAGAARARARQRPTSRRRSTPALVGIEAPPPSRNLELKPYADRRS